MNKYDALFVRALKSNSPEFRIRRLYCKTYYHVYSESAVVDVLCRIVKQYNLMTATNWIDGLNPVNGWQYGLDLNATYYQRCIALMSSYIRLTEVSRFDNYPIPARFRNMK